MFPITEWLGRNTDYELQHSYVFLVDIAAYFALILMLLACATYLLALMHKKPHGNV